MVGGEVPDGAPVVMDVVLEVLNSQAVDMLQSRHLEWIEGPPRSIGGSVDQEVNPGTKSLDVGRTEDGPTSWLQDTKDLREIILVMIDVFRDLDGNHAVDAVVLQGNGLVEIATVIGHLGDLEVELWEIAGDQIGVSRFQHLGTEEAGPRSDIEDRRIFSVRKQG